MALGPLVWLPLSFVGTACPSTGIGGIVPIFVCAGWLQSFIRQSFVVHWPLFSGHCLLCMWLLKWQAVVWAARVVSGGVGCMTWHAGNMKGARVVVDSGDMAVCVVVCGQLVLFVIVGVTCE